MTAEILAATEHLVLRRMTNQPWFVPGVLGLQVAPGEGRLPE